MPVYESQIPNLESTVSKPIAVQVAQHIRNNFFADSKIPISLIDQTGAVIEQGSTVNGVNDIKLDTENQIIARYTEIPDQELMLTTVLDNQEMCPIWYDDDLEAVVRPIKAQTTCRLTFTFTGATKAEVDNWVNYLYTKFARGSTSLPMDLCYELCIPEGILYVIKAIHEARESNAGYGDIFPQYVEQHLLFPHDYKTNYIGQGSTLVMRDKLCNVVARLEPEIPQASRADNNTYSADVEFSFRYDKPTSMTIDYPIFVHNTYINPDYFDTTHDRNEVMLYRYKSDYGLINNLSSLYDQYHANFRNEGFVFPAFDPFRTDPDGKPTIPIFTIQIAVDNDNPTLMLDLNTIEADTGLKLHPDTIAYLIASGERIFKYGSSAFHFTMYRNKKALDPDHYKVNQVGHVVADYDLNPRGNYHLTLSLVKDLGRLGDSGYPVLAKFGELTHAIIKTVAPNLPETEYPKLNNSDPIRPVVTQAALQRTVEKMPVYHRQGESRQYWFSINTIAVMSNW